MGVEIPDGFGQASLVFSCVGVTSPMVVTFGYFGADAESGPNAVAANAQTIFNLLTDSPTKLCSGSYMSTDYTFLRVDVQEYMGGEPVHGTSSGAPSVGQVTAPSVPANCAILVQKRSGLGGRRGRGRMYWPPAFLGEAFISAAGSLAGNVAPIQTRMSLFHANLTTAALGMVIHHGQPQGDFGGGDFELPPPTVVTSLAVQPVLATQRRRMR